jgi:hypothetical protein
MDSKRALEAAKTLARIERVRLKHRNCTHSIDAGVFNSFTKLLDREPFNTQRARVMSYTWNWIAFGIVIVFCAHSGFESYKQWRSESRFERSDKEAGN